MPESQIESKGEVAFTTVMTNARDMGWSIAFQKTENENDSLFGLVMGSGDFINNVIKGREDEYDILVNPYGYLPGKHDA